MSKLFFRSSFILLTTALLVASGFFIFSNAVSASANIFSDGFELGNFDEWTSHNSRWSVSSSDTHGGSNYKAVVSGDTGANDDILLKNISTSGYNSVSLNFYYKMTSMEGADHVYVEWYDGADWHQVADYTNQNVMSDWVQVNLSLPAGAGNNSNFAFRFVAHTSSISDRFLLDDVSLTGMPIPSATNSTIVCSPTKQIVGGTITCNITVKDQSNNPIQGALVDLSANGVSNTFSTKPVLSDANGNATITLSSTIVQTETVTATAGVTTLSTTPSVEFYVSNPTTANITASPKPQEASLTGVDVNLTLVITDQYGNPVNDGYVVTVTGTANTPGTVIITGDSATLNGQVSRVLNFNNKGDVTLKVNVVHDLVLTGDSVIHFVDTTAPVVGQHENISGVEATSYSGATVDYTNPTATDNIDGSVSVDCVPASGSTFVLGNTTVTCSATDGSSNTGTSTFTVEVVDTTAPVITAPNDITMEATAPLTAVDLGLPTVLDIADPSPVVINNAPVGGFPVGTTIVTWTATDASGNIANDTQTVIITDETVPVITAPIDQTFEATGPLTTLTIPPLVPATATDIADPNPAITYQPQEFPLGTTIVTWTATDASGNIATATSNITIVDTTPPTIAPHDNITAEATSADGAVVDYENPTATDLVDGTDPVSCAPVSGSQFALGDTTVTCNSTDSHGNTSQSTFTVHIVDTTPPTITAPADISQEDNGFMSTVADLGLPTVSDIADPNPTITNNAPLTFPLGTTVVMWTVTDDWGNSAVAYQNVTIYAGPITHIILTASPTELAFSDSSLITVTGKDQYENVVTNNNSTIIVLSADGGGSLDNTILTLSAGVATANLSKDSAGIVHVTASSDGLTPQSVTVTFTEVDTSSPFVESHTPINGATNVALNVHPVLVFDEPLDTATVSSDNIQLKKYSDDSVVPASVSPAEGDRQVIITPANPLDFNTQYYFVVLAGVTDKVGNPAIPYGKGNEGNIFTTIPDNTVLSVTGISAIKTYAVANGTYENGWSWIFNVTVPTPETELQMKFADWTSALLSTIPVANNVRYSSAQASNGPVEVTAANTYGNPLHLTGDLDSGTAGRQIQILVEAKVPESSVGGSYSTSYGILSNNP